MKVNKTNCSHIRKKVPFTGKEATMTLDMYSKKHVQQHGTKTLKRNPQPSQPSPPWVRHFNRTHYFGPGYWSRKSSAFLEQAQLLNKFQGKIREVKGMIDFKVQMDSQQRMLQQLKIDMTREQEAVAVDEYHDMVLPELQSAEPLVLMIDDEIIYDEEYKFDPIWGQ